MHPKEIGSRFSFHSNGNSIYNDYKELRGEIINRPHDRILLAEWLDKLHALFDKETIADLLADIQSEMDVPSRSLLYAIHELVGTPGLNGRLKSKLASFGGAFIAPIGQIWHDIARGMTPNEGELEKLKQEKNQSIEIYFKFIAPAIKNISFLSENVSDTDSVVVSDIKLTALRRFHESSFCLAADYEALLREDFKDYPERLTRIVSSEIRGAYKYEIIRNGFIKIESPLSGKTIREIDSVKLFGKTVYTFFDKEIFFLICDFMGSDIVGFYFPARSLAISLSDRPQASLSTDGLVSLRTQMLRRICSDPEAFKSAVRAPDNFAPKKVMVQIEKTENFAHHLWNFYSSLDAIVRLGLHDKVSRISFSGTEFFGPLTEIFPEISKIGVERPKRSHISGPAPFSPDEVLVSAGSMVILRSLPKRIFDAMRRMPSTGHIVPDKEGFPVVWIGLRLGDKSWVDQSSEVPKLISVIQTLFPNATFLLDGFSLPVGSSEIHPSWSDFAARLSKVAQAIIECAPSGARVVNMLGNTMRESVLWAERVDVYLAPFGTTQHKVGWFSHANGVVYAPPALAAHGPDSPGGWSCAISPTPLFISGEPAGSGARRGASRTREKMHNVKLNTAIVAAELIKILAKLQEHTIDNKVNNEI